MPQSRCGSPELCDFMVCISCAFPHNTWTFLVVVTWILIWTSLKIFYFFIQLSLIMLLIKSRNVACAISTIYILLQINLSLYMATKWDVASLHNLFLFNASSIVSSDGMLVRMWLRLQHSAFFVLLTSQEQRWHTAMNYPNFPMANPTLPQSIAAESPRDAAATASASASQ